MSQRRASLCGRYKLEQTVRAALNGTHTVLVFAPVAVSVSSVTVGLFSVKFTNI